MKPLHIGFDAEGKQLFLSADERKCHSHVIGSSGSGKSKFLEYLIRGDINNRQGFCLIDPHGTLYEDVVKYCAFSIPRQNVILLNLSQPDFITPFNIFAKNSAGDVSVQVDRRIKAILHAWDVKNADQTPTLERILRLVFTTVLEADLTLADIETLLNFEKKEERLRLTSFISNSMLRAEWQELSNLSKAKDFREEILSTKNRLIRFLTSTALMRFLGTKENALDLNEAIEQGKVILVNLAPSEHLSQENGRIFGSLLVNQFFECALRRKKDALGNNPKPYFLYIDEFQTTVSIDIADMLDQIRKFGIFLVLSHQRFGQIDENLIDAVLTNCKIKAVFGGLKAEDARKMAEELFIGKLDAKKIKVAIYQTKFYPMYTRDKVYASGSSRGFSESSGNSSSSGYGHGEIAGQMMLPEGDNLFSGSMWLSPHITALSETSSKSFSSSNSNSRSYGESWSDSESVADIPMFFPVPFEELSSVQFYTTEEQLTELTAALKEQWQRHCFIKIQYKETEPLLVPVVKDYFLTKTNFDKFLARTYQKQNAITPAEADKLIEIKEHALIKTEQFPEAPKQTNSNTNVFDNIPDSDPFGRE